MPYNPALRSLLLRDKHQTTRHPDGRRGDTEGSRGEPRTPKQAQTASILLSPGRGKGCGCSRLQHRPKGKTISYLLASARGSGGVWSAKRQLEFGRRGRAAGRRGGGEAGRRSHGRVCPEQEGQLGSTGRFTRRPALQFAQVDAAQVPACQDPA